MSGFFITFAAIVGDVKSRSLKDKPSASANEAADFSMAPFGHATGGFWACLEGLIFHGLEGLKALSAFFAFVIVGRHTFKNPTSRA